MRILIPTDGSPYSKAAVAFAAARARLMQNRPQIEVLNVQTPISARVVRGLGREQVATYQQDEAQRVIKPALATLGRAGVEATSRYLVGSAGPEVAALAVGDAVDLIVMGSHGQTGLRKLLFGSVTSAVLVSCTTAMLVVRDVAIRKKDSLRVGIALDGSAYGVAALRYVIRHRDLFGPSPVLSLVHVVPDLLNPVVPGFFGDKPLPGFKPESVEAMHAAAFEHAMAPARALLEQAGLTATQVRLVGQQAGDEIAAYAKQAKLDVIALGSQGYGAAESAALGSVATRLAARCETPLLLVRAKPAT